MIVERTTSQDMPELMKLAVRAFNESAYKASVPNIDYFMSLFIAAIHTPNECFAVKCVKDGVIIGFFTGALGDMGFCDKYIGMDKGFYVKPQFRGTSAIVLMWNEYKAWCKTHHAVPTVLIHYGEDNHKTYKLFEKLGMVERGRLFMEA